MTPLEDFSANLGFALPSSQHCVYILKGNLDGDHASSCRDYRHPRPPSTSTLSTCRRTFDEANCLGQHNNSNSVAIGVLRRWPMGANPCSVQLQLLDSMVCVFKEARKLLANETNWESQRFAEKNTVRYVAGEQPNMDVPTAHRVKRLVRWSADWRRLQTDGPSVTPQRAINLVNIEKIADVAIGYLTAPPVGSRTVSLVI